MNDDRPLTPPDPEKNEATLTPADLIHTPPEFAVAEETHLVESGEVVLGTSLWKDAWRRF